MSSANPWLSVPSTAYKGASLTTRRRSCPMFSFRAHASRPAVAALFLYGLLQLCACSQFRPHYFTSLPSFVLASMFFPVADWCADIPSSVIPARSVADDSIDAHILARTNDIDRRIIRQVMLALSPRTRQNVRWCHVPVFRGFPDYKRLPAHGLVVTYNNTPYGGLGSIVGTYVLFFDGKVQVRSNLTYDPDDRVYLSPSFLYFRQRFPDAKWNT